MAHAWMSGDFNGTVDIGGSIDATNYRQKWEWEAGTGLNGFYNTLSELTDNDTKLTITVTDNKPILLGRTKEAFSTPVTGVGAIPLISLSDYQGGPVSLQMTPVVDKGEATITLPVKDTENDNVIGQAVVNVSFSGVVGRGNGSGGGVTLNQWLAATLTLPDIPFLKGVF